MVITNAAYNNPNVKGLVYVAACAPDQDLSLGNFVDVTKLPKDLLIIDRGGFTSIAFLSILPIWSMHSSRCLSCLLALNQPKYLYKIHMIHKISLYIAANYKPLRVCRH